MSLRVWPADFGLLSADVQCLQFIAASKFCAAPITIVHEARPYATPAGQYPVFDVTPTKCADFDFYQFCDFLRHSSNDIVLDAHLSDSDRADAYAYSCLIKHSLEPAVTYTLWMDEPNYTTVTNRWHAQQVMFPFNLRHVNRARAAAEHRLRTQYAGEHVTVQDIEFAVTRQAIQCLNQLAAKLNDQKYFYGDRPSTLDAQVFGLLAVLIKLPLVTDRLQQHIKAHPNLTRFVEAICSIYMPLNDTQHRSWREKADEWELIRQRRQEKLRAQLREEQSKSGAKKKGDTGGAGEDDEFKTRDKVLFGMAAAVLSVVAAIHFGVVKVEISNVDDDNKRSSRVIETSDVAE